MVIARPPSGTGAGGANKPTHCLSTFMLKDEGLMLVVAYSRDATVMITAWP